MTARDLRMSMPAANSFKQRGFTVLASIALEHPPTGRMHWTWARTGTMSACGLNTRSRPIPMLPRRNKRVTCRRCLVIVLCAATRLSPCSREAA